MTAESMFLGRSDADLARVDPVWLNLWVAQGVPSLASLAILQYSTLVDEWAREIARRMPRYDRAFHRAPQDWDNDLHQFRLGLVCSFIHNDLGIRYNEEHKDAQKLRRGFSYTEPSDLFLNGVIETRRGTCANMTALHLAIGRRLGWPVSIAMAGWHQILRFDNGDVVWNIEASNTECGFRVNPDGWYQKEHDISQEAIYGGSDLTFLKPRQLLGLFFGMRGRHFHDMLDPNVPKSEWEYAHYLQRARSDFDTALSLYPQSRVFRRIKDKCDRYQPECPAASR